MTKSILSVIVVIFITIRLIYPNFLGFKLFWSLATNGERRKKLDVLTFLNSLFGWKLWDDWKLTSVSSSKFPDNQVHWRSCYFRSDMCGLTHSRCLVFNNRFPCMSQSIFINILINCPAAPGTRFRVCLWTSRPGLQCAGNLMVHWRAEMCLLRARSHCLTWHGSRHPGVHAMKDFLFDAQVRIVGKIVPPKKFA